jgi:hypothetical protein
VHSTRLCFEFTKFSRLVRLSNLRIPFRNLKLSFILVILLNHVYQTYDRTVASTTAIYQTTGIVKDRKRAGRPKTITPCMHKRIVWWTRYSSRWQTDCTKTVRKGSFPIWSPGFLEKMRARARKVAIFILTTKSSYSCFRATMTCRQVLVAWIRDFMQPCTCDLVISLEMVRVTIAGSRKQLRARL